MTQYNYSELQQYNECKDMEGDLYSWDTTNLKMALLKTYEIDKKDICKQNDGFLMIGPEYNYIEAMNYCRNIGAKTAVIKNTDVLDEIKQILPYGRKYAKSIYIVTKIDLLYL